MLTENMENIFKFLALSSPQSGNKHAAVAWRPLSVPVGCIALPSTTTTSASQRCENHKASIRNGNVEIVVWVGDFTHYELYEIWQAVRSSSTITVLTLHISGANEHDYHLEDFFSAVRASPQLVQLYLYYYHTLIDKSLPCLEQCLQDNVTLQRLCVRYSRTTDSVALVNAVLRPSQTLTKLDLMHCVLGPRGAKQVAVFLPTNHTLKELLLKGNSIGCSGAMDIALALQKNQTLHILDVSQNEIKCAGATALASMLKENQHLQVLELRANQIASTGAFALHESVRLHNVTLIRLDLIRNAPLTFDLSAVELLDTIQRLTATHQTVSRLILTLVQARKRLPRELFQVLATFL